MGVAGNYAAIRSVEGVQKIIDRIIAEGKPFGFDIEAGYTGPDQAGVSLLPHHPNWILVGISFTNNTDWARYVPIAHDNGDNVDDVYTTAKLIWKLLATGLGIPHHAAYEEGGLGRWFRELLWDDAEVGAEVRESNGFFEVYSDSMIEAFVVQKYAPKANAGPGVGLKELAKYQFGHEMTKFEDLFPELPKNKMKFARFNTREVNDQVVAYACEDSLIALLLHGVNYPECMALPYNGLIHRTEIALVPVLAQMELEGLEFDWAAIERRAKDTKRFAELANEAIQVTLSQRLGREMAVNLNSPPQVASVLFDKKPTGLGLPSKMQTDTGARSTGEEALRGLYGKDPIIRDILEYREIKKLLGSYLDKYLKDLRYASDGRAHPNHKQTGAATGRFSVDHVPYQQWPKPYHYELPNGETYDLNFRDFLIAPPGYRIVGFDFSQVELRILAGVTQEQAMLEAFRTGVDVHRATASTMMKVPLDEVTDKQRSQGKTLNFAIAYGSGADNIASMLGITKDEAQKLLDDYFVAFSGLKSWMDEQVKIGTRTGSVWTHFGRKTRIWEFERGERWAVSRGERNCVNAPIQGAAADYMKLGMVRVAKALKEAGLQHKVRMVMTIHDALEFYVHDSVTDQQVIDIVNPAVSFPVKGLPEIRADWHAGKKWGSVAEIELDEAKQIVGYSMKIETAYKEKFKFVGDILDDVLVQHAAWELTYEPPKREPKEEFQPEPEPAPVEEESLPQTPQDRYEEAVSEALASRGPQLITIQLVTSPNKQKMLDLVDYLSSCPGNDKVMLKHGPWERELNGTYALTDFDQPVLSNILDGAEMFFQPLEVEPDKELVL